jgi:DNA-binding NarL/FixJ family response regulator
MPSVSTQRIVLADGSRLLNEMLRRILHKAENFEVVEEIHNLEKLPADIGDVETDWVIMSLSFDEDMPDWVDDYVADHPYVGFLVVSSDSSRIKMKWSETHEKELDDLSLKELMHILKGHLREA